MTSRTATRETTHLPRALSAARMHYRSYRRRDIIIARRARGTCGPLGTLLKLDEDKHRRPIAGNWHTHVRRSQQYHASLWQGNEVRVELITTAARATANAKYHVLEYDD